MLHHTDTEANGDCTFIAQRDRTASDSDSDGSSDTEDGSSEYEALPAPDLNQLKLEELQGIVTTFLHAIRLDGAEYRRVGKKFENLLKRIKNGQGTHEELYEEYGVLIYE
jgi:hypothetical protein